MARKITLCLLWAVLITAQPSLLIAAPDYDTPKEKVEEYKAGALKGDPDAQFNLGVLTGLGWAGIQEDKAKSRELIMKSAEQGHVEAQIWVARLCLSGELTGKYDLSQAVTWYRKAAENGSHLAFFQLGCLHQEGNEMMEFFKKTDKSAIEIEPLKHAKELSKEYWAKAGLTKTQVETLIELHARISKGDWRASKELHDLLNGKELNQLNPEIFAAFHLAKYNYHLFDHYLQKAKDGDVNAMIETANSFEHPGCPGHPVPNTKEQFYWLKRAEEKGSVEALYKLGSYFSQNKETDDPKKSLSYYTQAAEKGHAAAMCSLALIYEAREDLHESTRWMIKAAEAGDTASWFYLGHRYQNGKGVPANFVKAYAWFSISSSNEKEGPDGVARGRIKLLAAQMPPEKIAEAQQLAAQIWENIEKKLSSNSKLSAAEKLEAQVRLDLERAKLRSNHTK
jgi:TPR repeat protein